MTEEISPILDQRYPYKYTVRLAFTRIALSHVEMLIIEPRIRR